MKAAISEKYGSPGVLWIKNVEIPGPNDHEVLIKVFATTVNRTDCAILRASPFIIRFFYGFIKPAKPVQGTDFAGMIESVGKDVTTLKAGDRVFGFDDNVISSHAEYLTLSENNALIIIPDSISYEQAAASIEGAHYALNFINKVEIKSGQKVLVNGATGAIGSAAVQLLKYAGANVTAVCKKKDEELVKSIGADRVIDYINEDFTKSDEKYKFVLDTVGKSSFARCKHILEPDGVYISSEFGWMAQNLFLPVITSIFGTKKVIFPLPGSRITSVLLIKKLLEEAKFQAIIDRRYSLEEIADAYRYVEKGQKIGNVIITYN
jgi:NADPH:quinone reductase-like Zn-dependent oxidoreductase